MNGICGSWDSWSRLLLWNLVGKQEKEGDCSLRRDEGQTERRSKHVHRLFRKRKLGGLSRQQGRDQWRDRTSQRKGNWRSRPSREEGEGETEGKLLLWGISFKKQPSYLLIFCMHFFVYTKELFAGCLYCWCLDKKAKHILTWCHVNTDWRIIMPVFLFFPLPILQEVVNNFCITQPTEMFAFLSQTQSLNTVKEKDFITFLKQYHLNGYSLNYFIMGLVPVKPWGLPYFIHSYEPLLLWVMILKVF